MPIDYQKLYHQLFNDVTDAIERLEQAQRRAEESYVRQGGVTEFPAVPPPSEKLPKG